MDIVTLGAAVAMAKKVMPQVTAADAGKLATVDSNGKWAAADLEVGQGEVAVDSTLLVSGAAADAKVTGERISAIEHAADDKASIDGYYEQMTVGNAEQLVATVGVEDKAPYNFRTAGGSADIGDRLVEKVVGGTVAWNQLWDEDVIPSESNIYSQNSYTVNGVTFTKNGDGSISIQTTAEGATARASVKIAASASNSSTAKQVAFSYVMQNHRHLSRGCPNGSATTYWLEYFNRSVYGDGYISTPNNSGFNYWLVVGEGAIITTPVKVYPQFYDLDLMFGSTIAAYLTSMGTGVNADGAKWFNNLFPEPYYAYDAGSILSVKTTAHREVGFNQWDEEWEVGAYNINGNKQTAQNNIRSKNFIPILPSTSYYFNIPNPSTNRMGICWYDKAKNLVYRSSANTANGQLQTSRADAYYITFYMDSAYGTTYNHDICINLHWDGERDGEYEPYEEHTYPLDDVELRGIPKLDANNNLYYDGDEYESDGTVTRKYRDVLIDGGTNGIAFVNSFGATNNGFAVYINTGLGERSSKVISDKFEFSSAGYSSMPLFSFVGGSGAITTWVFILPSTVTSTAEANAWAAQNPFHIIIPLATPTTESAEPYQNPQIVDDFGTEEYVDAGVTATTPTRDVAIPVGHVSQYQANLRAKLEMAPNSPDGDGDYIVRQTNGQNEYVALTFPADELPATPTENGTYTLKCTVSGSGTTYSWVAEA